MRFEPRFLRDADTAPAPGTLLKHYSPRAKLLLFQGRRRCRCLTQPCALKSAGIDASACMLSDADAAAFADLDVAIESLGQTAEQAALRLFAAMRALDGAGVDLILARAPEMPGLGLAVRDRLLRAAEGIVIDV